MILLVFGTELVLLLHLKALVMFLDDGSFHHSVHEAFFCYVILYATYVSLSSFL